MIESARRARVLPGLVARAPGGRVAGWSYFVVHDGRLQIGGLIAESDGPRRALLRAALSSPEAAGTEAVSCYLYPQSRSFRRVLEQEGFAVEPHHYMAAGLPVAAGAMTAPWPDGWALNPLSTADAGALVDLVARAYEGTAEGRCFAPDLRRDQWAHYVGQLMRTEACGRCLPDVSFTLEEPDHHLVAAILMTRIGEGTAHLAQVVVDPRFRGRGLARRLALESLRALAARGYCRVTLLVSGRNDGARRLYDRLGFRTQQVFLHATRAAERA
jgi:ribosomal protein S18 acetylase RimI-like enzyme